MFSSPERRLKLLASSIRGDAASQCKVADVRSTGGDRRKTERTRTVIRISQEDSSGIWDIFGGIVSVPWIIRLSVMMTV